MSFVDLIGKQSGEDRVVRWEHLFLEIQVLLAFADDQLDPSERMTLSVLSFARDENGNLMQVNETVSRVETEGISKVAKDVFGRASKMLREEPKEIRSKIAEHILKRSLSVVAADGVVSPNEKSFVLSYLAPGLDIDSTYAKKTLEKLDQELSLLRVYVERAFEMFVMLLDIDEHKPRLNSQNGEPLSGFLGAVDELVVQHSLGSSAAVAYFLSALGGTLWVERYRSFINYLSRLTVQVRELKKTSGRKNRLTYIHQELRQVHDTQRDPFVFRSMQRHMLNALGKLHGMSSEQVELFRHEIAPVLEIDFDELLRSLEGKPHMLRLLHNLQGARPPSDEDEGSWWKFWT